VPRKTIPAEALIDLTRRLVVLPTRSHERRLIIAEAAQVFGVSEPTLYRALTERSRPRALRRADRGYLYWLLQQVTAPTTKSDTLLTDAAATLLCERLTTPLQFELYLTRAFEEAFRVGQKPVDADTIAEILAPDLDGLEARLMRNGYNVKLLTEMLGAKPKEVRLFLTGHLPPDRTRELHDQLLTAGVPL
jgi:hypothetical protein